MTAAIDCRTELDLTPPVEPRGPLAKLMRTRAASIAHAFRRERSGDRQDPLEDVGALDGLVEGLVEELGHALSEPADLPTAPWARAQGVLRLSLTRGPETIQRDFGLLRGLLEQAASQLGANELERRRLRVLLDAAQAQALALLRHRLIPGQPAPAVKFGGVVLETA